MKSDRCLCGHTRENHTWPVVEHNLACLKCDCEWFSNVGELAEDAWGKSKWHPELTRQIYENGFKDGFELARKRFKAKKKSV